ncbi:MAG TPA: rhodanese-like domain-containing protein [Chitinophagales bacterium]|nr:rhodanese-like domain-containing protein [Chitinophagales bacterium]
MFRKLFPIHLGAASFVWVLFSCQSGSGQNALEPKDFNARLKKDTAAVLLDVRTPAEFAEGHLPGAHNIDFRDASFPDKVKNLDSSKTYYVYCRSGSRSAQAAKFMRSAGFKTVYELNGGILNWKENGLPLEKD